MSSTNHRKGPGQPGTGTNGKPVAGDAEQNPVFSEYGAPFILDEEKVFMNEVAVAVSCATVNSVRYNPTSKTYSRFDKQRGLWVPIHEVEVRRLLADHVRQLGREWHQEKFGFFGKV